MIRSMTGYGAASSATEALRAAVTARASTTASWRWSATCRAACRPSRRAPRARGAPAGPGPGRDHRTGPRGRRGGHARGRRAAPRPLPRPRPARPSSRVRARGRRHRDRRRALPGCGRGAGGAGLGGCRDAGLRPGPGRGGDWHPRRDAEGRRRTPGRRPPRRLAAIEASAGAHRDALGRGPRVQTHGPRRRLRGLKADLGLDDVRLYAEIARAVERHDVAEEVQRLRSHVEMAEGSWAPRSRAASASTSWPRS